MADETIIGGIEISGIEGSQIQIGDITVDVKARGDIVGRDKIVNNVNNFIQQATTAAREAEDAYAYATQRLADGVRSYAQRLAAVAAQTTDAAEGGPYKGLLAYRLSDANLFYGREQAIDTLLKIINRNPLTVLHSESGAGKSSLLQAGISPHLLVREGTHLPVYLRPYNISPTLAIKRAFLPNINDIPELEAAPLQAFLRQVVDVLGSPATLYLLLDQFEELFTVLKEDDQAAFVTDLATCLRDETLRVRWVLALRSEFFSDMANFRPEIENPFANEYRLNRLTREEAAQVIVAPAARQGIGFEPALVEALLLELRDDRGQLAPPQLQLVCSALYNLLLERQRTTPDLPSQITLTMYEEEGRARGILRGHLRRVLSRTLPTKQERDLARQVLVTLISSDQRRRRLTQSHLARELSNYITTAQDAGKVLEELDPLLGELVKSRLLNIEKDEETDEYSYELAHDYLLTEIEIDPELQAQKAAQEMLDQEVESYKRFNTLLSEDKFRIINSRREFLVLDDSAQELLQLSQEAIEGKEQEKEAQRQRELEQARKLSQRAKWIIGVGIAAMILAVVAGIFFFQAQAEAENARSAESIAIAEAERANVEAENARQAEETAQAEAIRALSAESTAEAEAERARLSEEEAQRRADIAQAQALAVTSQQIEDDNELQLLLAREAFSATTDAQVRWLQDNALRTGLGQPYFSHILRGHEGWVWSVAFSPDNSTLASGSHDRTVRLWDLSKPESPPISLLGHETYVTAVTFSPDGTTLSSGSGDGSIRLWNMSDLGAAPTILRGHEGGVDSVTFSPAGQTLASGGFDKTVRLWNLSDLTADSMILRGHEDSVNSVAFSSDGTTLASGSRDQTVRVWDLSDPDANPTILHGHEGWINSVAFSPDGGTLASGSDDNTVRLWNLSDLDAAPTILRGHEGRVDSVAFSPDGTTLASGSDTSNTVFLWDLSDLDATPTILRGHEATVMSVAFSADGSTLASSTIRQKSSRS